METSNMAYSLETSSVKTIFPGAEVSGFCDVVARQKINEVSGEVPQLSAGEGIAITNADGKTVITNNISAGENISLVYDMETNTYRIDGQGGNIFPMIDSGYIPGVQSYSSILSADTSNLTLQYSYSGEWMDRISSNYVTITREGVSSVSNYDETHPQYKAWSAILKPTIIWNSAAGQNAIGSGSKLTANGNGAFPRTNNSYTATGIYTPGYIELSGTEYGIPGSKLELELNNLFWGSGEDNNSIAWRDLIKAGNTVKTNSASWANAGHTYTGTNGTTGFTANMDCSSMMLTTGASPAGGYVKQTTRGVQYEAYPATDVSASWYNIINGANNRSNCYCIKLNSTNTAASLEDYSAYDRVTVIHAQDYGPDYLLHWDGKTKTFPSGLYCELAKVKDDVNEDKWTFLNSGWSFDFWWDYD